MSASCRPSVPEKIAEHWQRHIARYNECDVLHVTGEGLESGPSAISTMYGPCGRRGNQRAPGYRVQLNSESRWTTGAMAAAICAVLLPGHSTTRTPPGRHPNRSGLGWSCAWSDGLLAGGRHPASRNRGPARRRTRREQDRSARKSPPALGAASIRASCPNAAIDTRREPVYRRPQLPQRVKAPSCR